MTRDSSRWTFNFMMHDHRGGIKKAPMYANEAEGPTLNNKLSKKKQSKQKSPFS